MLVHMSTSSDYYFQKELYAMKKARLSHSNILY
jgi:hypothetical protein